VILGDANLDPVDGQGRHMAIHGLLGHPLIQDPQPASDGAVIASRAQGGANIRHHAHPKFDTVDWTDTPAPGNLRVDYVLPSAGLTVTGSGVFWPGPNDPLYDMLRADGKDASRHRLVWVDISLD
jgi:hypothetical protein